MPFNSTPAFQAAARTKLHDILKILVPTPPVKDRLEDIIFNQGLNQSSVSWETANDVLERLIYRKDGGLSIKNGKCFFVRALFANLFEPYLQKKLKLSFLKWLTFWAYLL